MFSSSPRRVLALVGLFVSLGSIGLFAPALFAQGTAQLTGRVVDPSGSVIPGATVTLTNLGSGVQQTGETGPQGYYRFPLLPPGNYRIEIRADGFRGVSQTGLKLDVEQAATLDVTSRSALSRKRLKSLHPRL
ncbi:MAG: carboxypeptidase-like regulatory domain-containing protein [Bryobacterales bacterium]